jgi:hypothetical protein
LGSWQNTAELYSKVLWYFEQIIYCYFIVFTDKVSGFWMSLTFIDIVSEP